MSTSPQRLTQKTFSRQLVDLSIGWGANSLIEEFDPDHFKKLINAARETFHRGELIRNTRLLRELAQGLWDTTFRLASKPNFLAFYINSIEKSASISPLKAIARQYLFHWPKNEREGGPISDYLRRNQNRMKVGWLKDAVDHKLFEGGIAIPALAKATLQLNDHPINNLEKAGLRGSIISGAYSQAVFEQACGITSENPSRASYECLIDFFLYNEPGDDEFRYGNSSARNAFIKAFLYPWRQQNPESGMQRWIIARLLKSFDDPRLSMGKWDGIEQQYIGILKRWLAQESLEQFLNIVDQSITDSDNKRMWKYRRPFWKSYFDANLVQEAWVLFGRNATRLAKHAASQDESFAESYGYLNSSDKSHSVLLMKIGDITIAEWSHNGKCWIWHTSHDVPKFYQKKMIDNECRGAPFGQIHSSAMRYGWQQSVAAELVRLGVPKTPQEKWRP